MNKVEQIAVILSSENRLLLAKEEQLKDDISKLPKGSLNIQHHRNTQYAILTYYSTDTKKTYNEYISADKLPLLKEKIDKRKQLENALRTLQKELAIIDKTLKYITKQIEKMTIIQQREEEKKQTSKTRKGRLRTPQDRPPINIKW